MRRISKDITKHCQMACSSGELHAIFFLWTHFTLYTYTIHFKSALYTIRFNNELYTLHYKLYTALGERH